MPDQVYRNLLGVMQARRGPYAGMDIPEFYALVEFLFTPECASGCPEEAVRMTAKAGFPTPPKDLRQLVAALKSASPRPVE